MSLSGTKSASHIWYQHEWLWNGLLGMPSPEDGATSYFVGVLGARGHAIGRLAAACLMLGGLHSIQE